MCYNSNHKRPGAQIFEDTVWVVGRVVGIVMTRRGRGEMREREGGDEGEGRRR